MKLNLQFFGGRGGSSGGGPASSGSAPSSSTGARANINTQAEHRSAISALSSDRYSDGTYDINTMEQVEYPNGYQVTFSQIGDNYSDAEYADKVNEFLDISSDGKVLAGKFESTPEISFHCNNKATAVRLAKKYNQISIWDWGKCDEIKTGGTGKRR